MISLLRVVLGLCCALVLHSEAADLRVKADVNDYKAPRSPIRSFDATTLTVSGLQKKVGHLKAHQVVGIWCEGAGMGTGGLSAFDVLLGNEVDLGLRRLGANSSTTLVKLCKLQQAEFEKTQR